MMRFRNLAAASLAIALAPAAAHAEDAASPQIVRLSPAQAEAAIESGATHPAPPGALDSGISTSRAIHGEIGAMVGTGGARGAYGTAAIPIGDNAGAVVSFASERYHWR